MGRMFIAKNFFRYRAPRDAHGRSDVEQSSFGFVDGDFLEQYLTLSPSALEQVKTGQNEAERLDASSTFIKYILEDLQSMH